MTASPSAAPAPNPAPGFAPSRAGAAFPCPPRLPSALVGVSLAHAGLLGVLVFAADSRESVAPPRPLMVSLVTPAVQKPAPQPAPRPEPPRPKVETPAPVVAPPTPRPAPEPPPVLAAPPRPMPAAVAEPVIDVPAPRPEPAPAAETLPPRAAVAAAEPAPPAAPPATPARPADYLANPKPPYPRLSRRLGEEGTVRLNILVNPDGSVARLELAESSGHPRLDRSAMDTVQSSWKFEPARQGGNPVAAWVVVPIQFTLRS